MLRCLPPLDDDARAARCQELLRVSPIRLLGVARSTLSILKEGGYEHDGSRVDLSASVAAEVQDKQSVPPDAALSPLPEPRWGQTRARVVNDTTLTAARGFSEAGHRPMVLNLANGVSPGGGWLRGARAQEETLCYASTLYAALEGDPFYERHRRQGGHASTDHLILSRATVFRDDRYALLPGPWEMDVITCAAPYCGRLSRISQAEGARLMKSRVDRVLHVAAVEGGAHLVLGAWGCGAFRNDPVAIAGLFREALGGRYAGRFDEVVFAIADWSPERRFLGPFRDAFRPQS